jgi:hypothetical protein
MHEDTHAPTTASSRPPATEGAGGPSEEQRLLIRPVRPEDDLELMDLFDTLDPDERHRRFFSSHHPGRDFCARLAAVDERGGARLVAVLSESSSDEERIIGEAGYDLLPNGDGELTITVAPEWRGWLGPFLLDAIVDVAAAAGVPSLETEVLTVDAPMLSLMRSRRSIVMEHDGWSVVRMLIGTAGQVPSWPGSHDRPRVLVEAASGRWTGEHEARAAGLEVLTCTGPHDDPEGCPVLVGEPCPLVAGADVIVAAPPPDDAEWCALLASHAAVHPGVPLYVRPAAGAADVVAFARQLGRHDSDAP